MGARLAAWLLVGAALAGCSSDVPEPPAIDVFTLAARRALETKALEDVVRARHLYETQASPPTPSQARLLGDLTKQIAEPWPVEALRLRFALARHPAGTPAEIHEVAAGLWSHGFSVAAEELLAKHPPGAEQDTQAFEKLSARTGSRTKLAELLSLASRTADGRRLQETLFQSSYEEIDDSFWKRAVMPVGSRPANMPDEEEQAFPACHAGQFARPQLVSEPTVPRQVEGFDVERRPISIDNADGSFRFTRVAGLALDASGVCNGNDVVRDAELRRLLAAIRKPGDPERVLQQLCVGRAAAVVLGEGLSSRILLVLPHGESVDVLLSDDFDPVRLRQLRGPDGQPVLYAAIVGGAHGDLSVAVLDLAARTQLLRVEMLEFGDMVALPMQEAGPDSLAFRFTVADGRKTCGQCPKYKKLVHLRPHKGRYEAVAEICSVQELPVGSSNPFMSANALASVLTSDDSFGLGYSDYVAHVKRALAQGKAPKEIAEQITSHYLELSDTLTVSGDFDHLARKSREFGDAVGLLPRLDPPLFEAAIKSAAITGYIDALHFQGRHDEAIAVGERALQDSKLVEEPRIKLDFANRLSVLHLNRGTFRAALPYLQLALDLGSDDAATHGNLAWYSNLAADYRRSGEFAAKAMHSASKGEGRVGINAVLMAMSRAGLGLRGEALDWLTMAAGAAASSGNFPDQAMAFIKAAGFADEIGEARLGIVLLEQALFFVDELTWASEGPEFMLTYSKLLLKEGKAEAAQQAARASAAMSNKRTTGAHANALVHLSTFALKRNDLAQALGLAREAFHGSIRVATGFGGESYQLASAESARRHAEWYFELLLRSKPDATLVSEELSRWKSFVLRDGLSRGVDPNAVRRPDAPGALDLVGGEAFVDYFIGERVSFAILARPGSMRLVSLPSKAADIAPLIARVKSEMDIRNPVARESIARDRVTDTLRNALRELHARLVKPLDMGNLPRHLYLAPDSAVGSVPWSALVDDRGRFVGESTAVLAVPGRTFFQARAACPQGDCTPRQRVGVLGNTQRVTFTDEDRREMVLPALKYARKEIEMMRTVWGNKLVERTDLSPVAAPASASSVDGLGGNAATLAVLHVVGHGMFSAADPATSRLFIEARSDAATAYVTAEQISKIDLRNLPLVTLGACESGSLDSRGGGEPQGLVRAFLVAGASQVIASQWLVDDQATLRLFTSMHRKLGRTNSLDAFFEAQRETARKYDHPYFWAAFQAYGRPQRDRVMPN